MTEVLLGQEVLLTEVKEVVDTIGDLRGILEQFLCNKGLPIKPVTTLTKVHFRNRKTDLSYQIFSRTTSTNLNNMITSVTQNINQQ